MFGAGGVIGILSGLVGAGGGFISVPFMTWCNVQHPQAVATSAALGFPIALAGTLSNIYHGWTIPGLAVRFARFHLFAGAAGDFGRQRRHRAARRPHRAWLAGAALAARVRYLCYLRWRPTCSTRRWDTRVVRRRREGETTERHPDENRDPASYAARHWIPLAGRVLACKPGPLRGQANPRLNSPLHLSPGWQLPAPAAISTCALGSRLFRLRKAFAQHILLHLAHGIPGQFGDRRLPLGHLEIGDLRT